MREVEGPLVCDYATKLKCGQLLESESDVVAQIRVLPEEGVLNIVVQSHLREGGKVNSQDTSRKTKTRRGP